MSSSESVIVVVPGCPAELIQELLSSFVLPKHMKFDVLLPPARTQEYGQIIEGKNFDKVRFLPSPSRRFFSTIHLGWLREKLGSSVNSMLLITKSPYHDLTIAIISLVVLLLSGKTITVLRKKQAAADCPSESVIDQPSAMQWLSVDLNPKILCKEIFCQFHRLLFFPGVPKDPWEISYFLMFAGLVIRRSLSSFFSSLIRKMRG